jgi:hypothetical protein
MKPFDFAQDRLRGIQDASAKNPGLHPGYKRAGYLEFSAVEDQ